MSRGRRSRVTACRSAHLLASSYHVVQALVVAILRTSHPSHFYLRRHIGSFTTTRSVEPLIALASQTFSRVFVTVLIG